MARIESISQPFTHAGIDKVVALYRDKIPTRYTDFVHTIANKQGYFRMAQEGDFPAATVMNQGTGVSFEDFKTGPYKDWYPIKRGIGFAVAREVVESDVTGIIKRRAPKMARAMVCTIEADMANHVNLATSTAMTPPDGIALAGTHSTDTGSFTNIITNSPALSVSSLEQAVQELMIQPSQTGDYLMLDGPYNLLVPPQLFFLAERITESVRLPQTNNNDPNPVKGFIKNVVVNPFFTSPTAWALVIAGDDENPLKMLNRRAFDTQEEFDKVKDVNIVVCTQIWTRMLSDWRGFAYSAGQ
jgi:hypothetical protein